MDAISRQTLRYVEETPGFKEAIERAKAEATARPAVTVSLARFEDDPLRLYACVVFAARSGIFLTFAP